MRENFPEGFMPIWATDDIKSVTSWINLTDKISRKLSFAYEEVLFGTAMSACSLPCTRTSTQTVLLEENFDKLNHSIVVITFEKVISVDRKDFPSFNLAQFISSIGGSMGIWLGVGVIQSIDLIIDFVFRKIEIHQSP